MGFAGFAIVSIAVPAFLLLGQGHIPGKPCGRALVQATAS